MSVVSSIWIKACCSVTGSNSIREAAAKLAGRLQESQNDQRIRLFNSQSLSVSVAATNMKAKFSPSYKY